MAMAVMKITDNMKDHKFNFSRKMGTIIKNVNARNQQHNNLNKEFL